MNKLVKRYEGILSGYLLATKDSPGYKARGFFSRRFSEENCRGHWRDYLSPESPHLFERKAQAAPPENDRVDLYGASMRTVRLLRSQTPVAHAGHSHSKKTLLPQYPDQKTGLRTTLPGSIPLRHPE